MDFKKIKTGNYGNNIIDSSTFEASHASSLSLRHNFMLRVYTGVYESRILSSLYILLTLDVMLLLCDYTLLYECVWCVCVKHC